MDCIFNYDKEVVIDFFTFMVKKLRTCQGERKKDDATVGAGDDVKSPETRWR